MEIPSGARPRGVVARYARRDDYHDRLKTPLATLSRWIDETSAAGTRSLWYVDTGPILERDLAQRAGIGFVGRHTGLVSPALGNWFLIAEILTTAEFQPDTPGRNRCGKCTRCLDACPTGALPQPFVLDARRCISYLTIENKGPIPVEMRSGIGNRIFGCDDCLAACPWNRFARESSLLRAGARPEFAAPDLEEWLSLGEAEFQRLFAGTPMHRTKRRGLLRNVCVALGNVGDRRALPALARAAVDPEPLVAEHARWAIDAILGREAAPEPVP
jgi:epoxyqueuosine reductase